MEDIYLTIDKDFVVHPHGYFITPHDKSNYYEDEFLDSLTSFFKERGGNVIDFGCGNGFIVKRLLKKGVFAQGFDGNPFTNQLSSGLCDIHDLVDIRKFDNNFDWVLCMEVGQHIPEKYENNFIENINLNNTKGVIISWAPEERGGIAHINCRESGYVRSIFEKFDYYNDIDTEINLRNSTDKMSPLRNSLMVFMRKQQYGR